MIDIALARALHVLAVVVWIGGVAMVTTVLLPAVRRGYPPAERLPAFHALEQRFAAQSRVTTVVAGATGFYMAWRLDAWSRFGTVDFWWMHMMVFTWAIFTLMLFIAEPLFLERILSMRAKVFPESTYRRVEWLHRVLLVLSLLTIAGAVCGSQGINLLHF